MRRYSSITSLLFALILSHLLKTVPHTSNMVKTKEQKEKEIKFLYDEVLNLNAGSMVPNALADRDVRDVDAIGSLSMQTIGGLDYKDPDDKTKKKPLSNGDRQLIRMFVVYMHHLAEHDQLPDVWDANNVDPKLFRKFRMSQEPHTRIACLLNNQDYKAVQAAAIQAANLASTTPPVSTGTPVTTSSPAPINVYNKHTTLLTEWLKGKRDTKNYPELTSEKNWDSWNRTLKARAMQDETNVVLDTAFKPSTQEEKELFDKQKVFMYVVFDATVLTDTGKTIVRNHEAQLDSQAVYRDLLQHHSTSTYAMIGKQDLFAEIVAMNIRNWPHSQTQFLLAWKDKLRRYKELNAGQDIDDGQKLVLLQRSVQEVPSLARVKNDADIIATQTGKSLDYHSYLSLLESTAQQFDSAATRNATGATRKGHRQALRHDLKPHDEETVSTYDDISILDMSYYDVLRAASTPADRTDRPQRPRVRLADDQWQDLDDKARSLWKSISSHNKAIILRYSASHRPDDDLAKQVHRITSQWQDTDAADFMVNRAATYYLLEQDDASAESQHTDSDTRDASIHDLSINNTSMKAGDPRRTLSDRLGKAPDTKKHAQVNEVTIGGSVIGSIVPDGTGFRFEAKNTNVTYRVSRSSRVSDATDMIDRGANGGVAGSNMKVLHRHPSRSVDVEGYDQHCTTNIPLVTCANVVQTQHGEVLAVYHNYAYTGKGRTIHSVPQLEAYKQQVDDKSIHAGGLQRLTTVDGYIMPIDIINALPYIKSRPCTDDDVANLPHVIMTSDTEWDPTTMDFQHDLGTFCNATNDGVLPDHRFDERGDYRHRHSITAQRLNLACGLLHQPSDVEPLHLVDMLQYEVHERNVTPQTPDYSSLRPNFLWHNVDTIRRTFDATTQMARIPMSNVLSKWFKSHNPAINTPRRNEDVATDTVYADVPAVDDGSTMAQFFCGTTSLVVDVHGMKTEKQFPDALEDCIRRRGAPTRLLSDHAAVETSARVKDLLRALHIGDWQSEAYMQHQNFAERRWQDVKRITNTVLDRSGSPEDTWLLALHYVCFVLNHMATASIDHRVPLQVLTGSTVDISILLRFVWYEPVYYRMDDSSFPSESREGHGYFVGFAEHVGTALTYRILTSDTRKIIERSSVRSAQDPSDPNLRLDIFDGEAVKEFIKSRKDSKLKLLSSKTLDEQQEPEATMGSSNDDVHKDGEQGNTVLPEDLRPQDLVGRTILVDQEDGTRLRAKILQAINDSKDQDAIESTSTKLLIAMGPDKQEELWSYQQVLDHINKDMEDNRLWKFRTILGHQGPLSKGQPDYRGSSYNVQIEWENGEITYEPLNVIALDDPVSCAIYAKKHDMLDTPGWKRFAPIARRHKKLLRMANQAKLKSFRTANKYMYGVEIPRDYLDAVRLDRINGNTKWQDCTKLELEQLGEYKTFKDIGYKAATPNGYKRIRVHLVYAVKHDGRHKARLVADGHLTDLPVDSVYSGVVSLKGLRAMLFIAELNGLPIWSTDIGNAYLEATTQEKVCITAGPEFGDLQGHTLVIVKALYGLRSSGLRWHEKFADCLRDEGFTPCKVEPDIWLRRNNDHYEYVCVYVDDLAFAMKDPSSFVSTLENKYSFKLKGTGELSFHLGCDFFRDDDGTLCMSPIKYIERMIDNYVRMFGEKPKQNVMSPLEKGDHPELDDSALLDAEGIQHYQSLIGSTQWAISLGRLDVQTAIMTLSSFRSAPRIGHLERAKRVVRYLARFKHGAIKFRTRLPDYSDLPDHNIGWDATIYANAAEETPLDAPTPLGPPVIFTRYVDANLYHDWINGRSVTGILTLVNQTPLEWYSKKQATVETATYGSEFIATRTATEKSIEDRTLFRYLGVPIIGKDYMFGDNESVVNSSTRIDSKLHKRHNALSYHKVREAIAAGFTAYYHVASEHNLADILSKHWGYNDVWMLLQALLFWKSGDTADIPDPKQHGAKLKDDDDKT